MRTLLLALLLIQTASDEAARWRDATVGTKRIEQIRSRIRAATPCPWKSDGRIEGWWGGEQPGVIVRSAANLRDRGSGLVSMGGPVAQVPSAYWTGSHNPLADADFIAHSCEDITYLLKQLEAKDAAK